MTDTSVADHEVKAIRSDAAARLAELRAVQEVLAPDADDPEVMSELVMIQGQIRAADEALGLFESQRGGAD